ncbi:MAG TPA: ComF family protein [Roseiflexaceae bacterium]|nr:ComF family protein [Roseiflexaceae bacterium]
MPQSLIESLLSVLFPERCVGCARPGALFCESCRATLQPYSAQRSFQHPELDGVFIGFTFAGPLREAIHRFKYQRRRRCAGPLGTLLAAHVPPDLVAANPTIVPVPLHAARQAERGFNQAQALAEEVARTLNLPLMPAGLVRQRATEQQARLDARSRHANVRDAFAWERAGSPPERLILVDDVITTGATVAACAETLRRAGAREVYALALARSR